MPVESDLGTLIRMLNPHTDGSEGTIHLAPAGMGPPASAPRVDPNDLAQIQLEIDNGTGVWPFKTGTMGIQRAIKIQYRYPLKDANGNLTGLFAIDHLMIGYANGGSQPWP
jgi:hypothetical protein